MAARGPAQAVLHDEDLVGVDDGGEPVGDGDHGAAGGDPDDGVMDRGLGQPVQLGGRLVQQQDLGLAHQGPGQCDALALAAGDDGAVQRGVQTLWEGADLLVEPDGPQYGPQGLVVRLGIGVAQVLPQGARHQRGVLLDVDDPPAQLVQRILGERDAVEGDSAVLRLQEA